MEHVKKKTLSRNPYSQWNRLVSLNIDCMLENVKSFQTQEIKCLGSARPSQLTRESEELVDGAAGDGINASNIEFVKTSDGLVETENVISSTTWIQEDLQCVDWEENISRRQRKRSCSVERDDKSKTTINERRQRKEVTRRAQSDDETQRTRHRSQTRRRKRRKSQRTLKVVHTTAENLPSHETNKRIEGQHIAGMCDVLISSADIVKPEVIDTKVNPSSENKDSFPEDKDYPCISTNLETTIPNEPHQGAEYCCNPDLNKKLLSKNPSVPWRRLVEENISCLETWNAATRAISHRSQTQQCRRASLQIYARDDQENDLVKGDQARPSKGFDDDLSPFSKTKLTNSGPSSTKHDHKICENETTNFLVSATSEGCSASEKKSNRSSQNEHAIEGLYSGYSDIICAPNDRNNESREPNQCNEENVTYTERNLDSNVEFMYKQEQGLENRFALPSNSGKSFPTSLPTGETVGGGLRDYLGAEERSQSPCRDTTYETTERIATSIVDVTNTAESQTSTGPVVTFTAARSLMHVHRDGGDIDDIAETGTNMDAADTFAQNSFLETPHSRVSFPCENFERGDSEPVEPVQSDGEPICHTCNQNGTPLNEEQMCGRQRFQNPHLKSINDQKFSQVEGQECEQIIDESGFPGISGVDTLNAGEIQSLGLTVEIDDHSLVTTCICHIPESPLVGADIGGARSENVPDAKATQWDIREVEGPNSRDTLETGEMKRYCEDGGEQDSAKALDTLTKQQLSPESKKQTYLNCHRVAGTSPSLQESSGFDAVTTNGASGTQTTPLEKDDAFLNTRITPESKHSPEFGMPIKTHTSTSISKNQSEQRSQISVRQGCILSSFVKKFIGNRQDIMKESSCAKPENTCSTISELNSDFAGPKKMSSQKTAPCLTTDGSQLEEPGRSGKILQKLRSQCQERLGFKSVFSSEERKSKTTSEDRFFFDIGTGTVIEFDDPLVCPDDDLLNVTPNTERNSLLEDISILNGNPHVTRKKKKCRDKSSKFLHVSTKEDYKTTKTVCEEARKKPEPERTETGRSGKVDFKLTLEDNENCIFLPKDETLASVTNSLDETVLAEIISTEPTSKTAEKEPNHQSYMKEQFRTSEHHFDNCHEKSADCTKAPSASEESTSQSHKDTMEASRDGPLKLEHLCPGSHERPEIADLATKTQESDISYQDSPSIQREVLRLDTSEASEEVSLSLFFRTSQRTEMENISEIGPSAQSQSLKRTETDVVRESEHFVHPAICQTNPVFCQPDRTTIIPVDDEMVDLVSPMCDVTSSTTALGHGKYETTSGEHQTAITSRNKILDLSFPRSDVTSHPKAQVQRTHERISEERQGFEETKGKPNYIVSTAKTKAEECDVEMALPPVDLAQSSLECLLEMLIQRGKVLKAFIMNNEGEMLAKSAGIEEVSYSDKTTIMCALRSTYGLMVRIPMLGDTYTCLRYSKGGTVIGKSETMVLVAKKGLESTVVAISNALGPGSCIKEVEELSRVVSQRGF